MPNPLKEKITWEKLNEMLTPYFDKKYKERSNNANTKQGRESEKFYRSLYQSTTQRASKRT